MLARILLSGLVLSVAVGASGCTVAGLLLGSAVCRGSNSGNCMSNFAVAGAVIDSAVISSAAQESERQARLQEREAVLAAETAGGELGGVYVCQNQATGALARIYSESLVDAEIECSSMADQPCRCSAGSGP